MTDINSRYCKITGFLAFDSTKKDAFGPLPDAFKYRESIDEYHNLLRERAQFHIGAALADALGVFLEPLREDSLRPKE